MEARRELQLSTLLESMPEGVLILDSEARILDANSAAERFAGRTRDQMRGITILELARQAGLQEADRPVDFPSLAARRALRGETVRNEHRTFKLQNGQTIEALVSASPLRNDGEGEIVGAMVLIRDITELTELQKRLSATERHRAVGQMAAGLAHDFNNVLDTVEKAATVMDLRTDATASQRQVYLGAMHNAVRRGAEIIARLRQYLRDGSADVTLVDVKQVVQEALELTRPLSDDVPNLTVRTGLQPVSQVRANAGDLRRVFTNLIINATEAMPSGRSLTVDCEQRGGLVRVRLRDTGIGVPREQQAKVFYPYFTTKATGTGLGLSGAQRIVLAAGGNIKLESEPGKGTVITVELPVAEAASGHAVRTLPVRPRDKVDDDRNDNGGKKAA